MIDDTLRSPKVANIRLEARRVCRSCVQIQMDSNIDESSDHSGVAGDVEASDSESVVELDEGDDVALVAPDDEPYWLGRVTGVRETSFQIQWCLASAND